MSPLPPSSCPLSQVEKTPFTDETCLCYPIMETFDECPNFDNPGRDCYGEIWRVASAVPGAAPSLLSLCGISCACLKQQPAPSLRRPPSFLLPRKKTRLPPLSSAIHTLPLAGTKRLR